MTDRAVAKLQALVRIPTVSDRDPARVDGEAFDRLLGELRAQFPLLHDRLELTRVGTHGLLFCWAGRAHAKPLVLMAHLDVVPVDESAPWRHPAFAAEVEDGAVWGRGTLDDKGCVAAICEAVERLLESGHQPAQDVWLSFGCDEEVSGSAAVAAVEELERRGVRPWLVLDEGGAVAHDAFPGVRRPVAAIGVAEKGTTSVELRVEGRGGHASTPTRNGPTVRLARAVLRIDRSPMPARLSDTTAELVRRLAPHLPTPLAPLRPLLGRPDRMRPLLTRALTAAGAEAAAMVRTTFAITTLEGSPALNVIASSATAGVNIRVLPGDSVDGVLAHLREVIDDPEVRIRVIERDPTEIPDHDYNVAVFANRFPSFAGPGRTEVVCFTSDHNRSFADLSPGRVRLVVEALGRPHRGAERPAGRRAGVPVREPRREIGVTLQPPARPDLRLPVPAAAHPQAMARAREHFEAHRRNLFADILAAERRTGTRIVAANETGRPSCRPPPAGRSRSTSYPHRQVADIPALTDAERDAFGPLYLDVLRRFDGLFDDPLPYIAAWHQAPVRVDRELGTCTSAAVSIRRAAERSSSWPARSRRWAPSSRHPPERGR